jgi:hypothetical protein
LIGWGLNRIHPIVPGCSEALASLTHDPPAFKCVGGKNQALLQLFLQLFRSPIEKGAWPAEPVPALLIGIGPFYPGSSADAARTSL